MKSSIKAAAAVLLAASAGIAQAHPGVHHLNGVGHSIAFADELTLAALAVWAVAMVALAAKLVSKRRRDRS
jgi:hypothetical protein